MRTRMVMSPEKSVSHTLETMLFTRTKPFCWATQARQHLSFAMLSLVLGPSKLRKFMAPAAMTLKSRLPLINMAAGYWTCRWQAQRIAQKPFTHIYSLIGILKGTTCHIKNELFSWFLYKEDFSQKTLRQPSKPCLNSLTNLVWSSREAACSNMMQKRRRKEWSANSVNASTSTGLHLAMMMVCGTTWNHCLQLMKRRSRSGTKKRLRGLNMMWNNVRFNCNICKMNIINFTRNTFQMCERYEMTWTNCTGAKRLNSKDFAPKWCNLNIKAFSTLASSNRFVRNLINFTNLKKIYIWSLVIPSLGDAYLRVVAILSTSQLNRFSLSFVHLSRSQWHGPNHRQGNQYQQAAGGERMMTQTVFQCQTVLWKMNVLSILYTWCWGHWFSREQFIVL